MLSVSAEYEYLDINDIASFRCENEFINKIWDVCAYTFHLCSREFYIDGIKRNRWNWDGMIKLGATTICEAYDPDQKGAKHYEMYSKKYGKSLCRAWGCGPIYLLGRYCAGVYPTSPDIKQSVLLHNWGRCKKLMPAFRLITEP